MTYRTVIALVFALIVAAEIFFFINEPTPMKTEQVISNNKWVTGGQKEVIDYQAQRNENMKYALIIGSTLLVGGIVTFSVPNKPLHKEESPSF